jgi:TRAP-type mannitol/chloroaromatic compound transport system substrate-binding protein
MKKFLFLIGFLIAFVGFLTYGIFRPTTAEAKVIKWKMSTTWTSGLVNLMAIDKHFAEIVNELAAGELEIKFF